MSAKERNEHRKLLRLWATRRATMKQMRRCMELDRKAGLTQALTMAAQ